MNKCIDCGKILSTDKSKRCDICNRKYLSGKNHPSWKGGYPNCIDCGIKISYSAKRCMKCHLKNRKKPIRRCLDCNKKITNHSKRCKPCSYKARHKEKPKCIDCGGKKSYYTKRCRSCQDKYHSGKNHYNYKGGRPKCTDCNKLLKHYSSKRCRPCQDKFEYKKPNKCIDCGKEIYHHAKRCVMCAGKARRKEKNRCIDCNKEIGQYAKRCKSCFHKYSRGKNGQNWKGGPKYLYCIDCGKKLKGHRAKICKLCHLEQLRLMRVGKKLSIKHRKNISLSNIGRKLTKKHRKKLSLAHRDKKLTDEHVRNILKSVCNRPNKFETRALNYLNIIYNNKFKYTGDGSLIINHRSADAYAKKLNTIALFHGCYWHLRKYGLEITEENKRSVEKVDSLPFTSAGYKVIFIWEDELIKISTRLMKRSNHVPKYLPKS